MMSVMEMAHSGFQILVFLISMRAASKMVIIMDLAYFYGRMEPDMKVNLRRTSLMDLAPNIQMMEVYFTEEIGIMMSQSKIHQLKFYCIFNCHAKNIVRNVKKYVFILAPWGHPCRPLA